MADLYPGMSGGSGGRRGGLGPNDPRGNRAAFGGGTPIGTGTFSVDSSGVTNLHKGLTQVVADVTKLDKAIGALTTTLKAAAPHLAVLGGATKSGAAGTAVSSITAGLFSNPALKAAPNTTAPGQQGSPFSQPNGPTGGQGTQQSSATGAPFSNPATPGQGVGASDNGVGTPGTPAPAPGGSGGGGVSGFIGKMASAFSLGAAGDLAATGSGAINSAMSANSGTSMANSLAVQIQNLADTGSTTPMTSGQIQRITNTATDYYKGIPSTSKQDFAQGYSTMMGNQFLSNTLPGSQSRKNLYGFARAAEGANPLIGASGAMQLATQMVSAPYLQDANKYGGGFFSGLEGKDGTLNSPTQAMNSLVKILSKGSIKTPAQMKNWATGAGAPGRWSAIEQTADNSGPTGLGLNLTPTEFKMVQEYAASGGNISAMDKALSGAVATSNLKKTSAQTGQAQQTFQAASGEENWSNNMATKAADTIKLFADAHPAAVNFAAYTGKIVGTSMKLASGLAHLAEGVGLFEAALKGFKGRGGGGGTAAEGSGGGGLLGDIGLGAIGSRLFGGIKSAGSKVGDWIKGAGKTADRVGDDAAIDMERGADGVYRVAGEAGGDAGDAVGGGLGSVLAEAMILKKMGNPLSILTHGTTNFDPLHIPHLGGGGSKSATSKKKPDIGLLAMTGLATANPTITNQMKKEAAAGGDISKSDKDKKVKSSKGSPKSEKTTDVLMDALGPSPAESNLYNLMKTPQFKMALQSELVANSTKIMGDPPTGSTSTVGLQPKTRKAVSAMMAANPNLKITSGHRTSAQQAYLYAAKNGQGVAKPGMSAHQTGNAADLGPPSQFAWIAKNAAKYGLTRPDPQGEPWHVQTMGDASTTTGAAVVSAADSFLGVNYVWGGGNASGVTAGKPGDPDDPNAPNQIGLDCSGLVVAAYGKVGITNLPRTSQAMASVGSKVASLAQAQPGDLLIYSYGSSDDHVAIYIGNNKQIAAPQTGQKVQIQSVDTGSLSTIRRVVGGGAGANVASAAGSLVGSAANDTNHSAVTMLSTGSTGGATSLDSGFIGALSGTWLSGGVGGSVGGGAATSFQIGGGTSSGTTSSGGTGSAGASSTSTSTGSTTPPSAGALSANAVYQLAVGAGLSAANAQIATAVAKVESGFRPDAVDHDSNGTTDYGLWQINSVHGVGTNMFTPSAAAAEMAKLSNKGTNWGPWGPDFGGGYGYTGAPTSSSKVGQAMQSLGFMGDPVGAMGDPASGGYSGFGGGIKLKSTNQPSYSTSLQAMGDPALFGGAGGSGAGPMGAPVRTMGDPVSQPVGTNSAAILGGSKITVNMPLQVVGVSQQDAQKVAQMVIAQVQKSAQDAQVAGL